MYESQIVSLEDQNNSLVVSLKSATKQKVDVEPLKKHTLMIRNNIHQMKLQIVEERFKVQ